MIAFPGAEGFGANSVGGRGGTVYEITNTDDSGSGSFREAVEASGARTVVFRTGGTITLTSQLKIANPYITIAGQTAPGGGICLKGSGTWNGSTLSVQTHNVIVRHIRSRIGAMTGERTVKSIVIGKDSTGDVHDVIIDHCSFSWATDENITLWYDPYDITVQWCIISEGLHDSTHPGGPHSMGIMVGSDGHTNISIHHNLIAHNNGRSPRITRGGLHDFVNNVVYNPGVEIGVFDSDYADLSINYVGNYVKKGGDSDDGDYEINLDPPSNAYNIYLNGNIGPNRATDDLAENLVVVPADRANITSTTLNTVPAITTTSATAALTTVLADAGANKTLDSFGVSSNNRDSVDTRVVADVRNITGSIIDDPSEVGGWPTLAAGTAPTDSDSDGMPDDWENLYKLDPNDSTDNILDRTGDGYDNLEEYFNGPYVESQTTNNLPSSVTGFFAGKYAG